MANDRQNLIRPLSRRDVLGIAAIIGIAAGSVPLVSYLLSSSRNGGSSKCQPWPVWKAFIQKHIESSGRVIDYLNADLRTTSEGQSYGLFFALINNDIALFERLLSWTFFYLCAQHPDQRLPAWLWGQGPNNQMQVLDDNTASDADLWIAYCLLEAGQMWKRQSYTNAGVQLLQLIAKGEVIDIPGLGMMLMPSMRGFSSTNLWTLNPSYLPIMLLRRCAQADPTGPWAQVADNSLRLIVESAKTGFSPDWIAWDGDRFTFDPARNAVGSYDAIRVYLWAGMMNDNDPAKKTLLKQLYGPQNMLKSQQYLSEKIDTATGSGSGQGPIGFSAALLPYLSALGENAVLEAQNKRIPNPEQPEGQALPYYERMLILFGQGWYENRYRFAADGSLLPAWRLSSCSATNSSL